MDWLIIFIIMGIVSSLINKKNQPSKKRNTPAPRPGTFQKAPDYPTAKPVKEWKSPFPDLEETLKKLEKQFSGESTYPWDNEVQQEVVIKKPVAIKKIEETRKEAAEKNPESVINPERKNEYSIDEKTDKNTIPLKQLSASQAAQGMMWAEVFGPPRSQNPHYSYKK